MAVRRMQVAWQMDSNAARDAMIITPHFKVTDVDPVGSGVGDQQLVDDLATALAAWSPNGGQLTVKAYDAQGLPPHFPLAIAQRRAGTFTAATVNRDVALCLSYLAGLNRPRYRGRLYIPCAVKNIAPGSPRPTALQQQQVADLVPIFTGLGGVNVDWVVWSRADNAARTVTHWWVDNAWDTQRRRGLIPTARVEGDTSG